MTGDQSKAQPTQSNSSPSPNDDPGPVHMMGVAIALRDIAQRLLSVEERLDKNRDAGSRKGATFIEFCKVVFGGWPALGFLFLLLFYSPLREALNAIPEKVKTAEEIGMLGVSLKSTIQVEAAKLGESNLSATIPSLSSAAIELLLRAPRKLESLISYTYTANEQREYDAILFPSPSVVAAMSELQAQGLIEIETYGRGTRKFTGANTRELIDEFRRTHPGREEPSFRDGRAIWKLNTPLPRSTKIPMLTWQLTDLGKKAVEIILKAVSTELAPTPSRKSKP